MKKKHRLHFFALFALFIFIPQNLYGASYSSALNAYEKGDLNSAIHQFTELAFNNDGSAQYMLGKIFAGDEGFGPDYARSYAWLHLAEQNDVDAAARLKRRIGNTMSRDRLDQAQWFIDEWLSIINASAQAIEIIDPAVVRQVQQILAGEGYYNRQVDGLVGDMTRTAIKRYQQAAGLPQDGRVTKELLGSMQITEAFTYTPPEWDPDTDRQELAQLKQKLRRLAHRAREQGSTELWLVRQLEALVGEEVQLWPRLVLEEDFTSLNYQEGADWRVLSGNFQLDRAKGLIIMAGGNWGDQNYSPDDITSRLLDLLLNPVEVRRSDRRVAKMEVHKDYANSFALQATTGSFEQTEALIFSCGHDIFETSGYRLILQPGAQYQEIQAKLFRVDENIASEIKTFSTIVIVNDSNFHTVEWTRNSNGEMKVTVDGQIVLDARFTGEQQSFAKLGVAHVGDRLELHKIKLSDSTMD